MTADIHRPRWPTSTKVVVSVALLVLLVYLLDRFSAAVAPLILAGILAFVLKPLVDRAEERLRLPRGLATLLVYLVVIGILAVLPALVVPGLIDQFQRVNLDLLEVADQIETIVPRTVSLAGLEFDLSLAAQEAMRGMELLIEPIFGQSLIVVVEVITSFVWLIFILVVSFYLIKDSRALWEWIEKQPPPAYRADFLRLKAEIYGIWRDFLRGQLVLATVVGTLFTLIGLLLGLPFFLALGLLAGLMEFIPSIGHGIWIVIATLLTLVEGSTWLPFPNWLVAVILVGVHAVFTQVDLNYLIPRIIGRRVHLHPLVVILGIVAGATVAGVLGVVLAAPTIASARVLGRYVRAYLFDQEPAVVVDEVRTRSS